MQPFAGSPLHRRRDPPEADKSPLLAPTGFRGSKFTGNQEPSWFGIPIIYMSGYPDEVIKEKAEIMQDIQLVHLLACFLLRKPNGEVLLYKIFDKRIYYSDLSCQPALKCYPSKESAMEKIDPKQIYSSL